MLDAPQVKVCGLTNGWDVDQAAEAGATAFGFVWHTPSPRHVPADDLPGLLARVPVGALRVLVVVDAIPQVLRSLLRRTRFDAVQLCGQERPADFADLGVPILRRLGVAEGAEAELDAWSELATGFVLDHPSGPGGTGRPVDSDHARSLATLAPCWVAGGLDGHNVAQRLAATGAVGADASSALESAPGRKDPRRVRDFVREARRALGIEEVSA